MFSFVVLLVEELGIAFSFIVASSAANVNFRRTCCHEFAACCYQLPHSFAMNLLHVVLLMQTSIMKATNLSATIMIATFSSGMPIFVTDFAKSWLMVGLTDLHV